MKLKLTEIRRDDSAQPRAMLNTDHIKDLADALEGGDLVPVEVFYDRHSYWLADGFHRYAAYHRAKREEIPVNVHEGDLRAAVLYSITANTQHSVLKMTRDEKRMSVTRLLSDKEWGQWSNREIARRAGVNDKTVASVRRELSVQLESGPSEDVTAELRSEPPERTYTTKHGTTAKMQTANIGSTPKPLPPAPQHPRHLQTYSPPLTPEEPEEDDRLEYDPPEVEIIYDEANDENEPYIPPYVSNPVKSPFEIKKLSNEPKPKEPPFVVAYTLLGKVRSMGHRTLIDGLNSVENEVQEQALENQVKDVIEMLRASLKQAEIERKTVIA